MLSPSSCASPSEPSPSLNRHVRSSTSKGFLITGARTRVSSILHPIVRSSKKMKLKCCESSGKSSCWSVDSFIADVNVVRHSTFDVGKCKSQLSRRAMNTNTNLHLIFHTLCIELAANNAKCKNNCIANPFFMRWVFQTKFALSCAHPREPVSAVVSAVKTQPAHADQRTHVAVK